MLSILIDRRSLYFRKAIRFPSLTFATSLILLVHFSLSLSEMIFFELFGFRESNDGKYSEIFFELFGFRESNDGKYKINCEIKRKLKVCLYDLLEFW